MNAQATTETEVQALFGNQEKAEPQAENDAIPRLLVIFWDLEGTGLQLFCDPDDRAQPTEIGAVIAAVYSKPGEVLRYAILDTFQQYVHTDRVMSDKVQSITKITAKTLQAAPKFHIAAERFLQFVTRVCAPFPNDVTRIAVAHNGDSYDLPLYALNLEDIGESAYKYFARMRFSYSADTLVMSRDRDILDPKLLPRDHTGNACYKLGGIYQSVLHKPLIGAHGAVADCTGLLELVFGHEGYWNTIEADLAAAKPKYLSNPMRLVTDILSRAKEKKTPRNKTDKRVKTMDQFFKPAPKKFPENEAKRELTPDELQEWHTLTSHYRDTVTACEGGGSRYNVYIVAAYDKLVAFTQQHADADFILPTPVYVQDEN